MQPLYRNVCQMEQKALMKKLYLFFIIVSCTGLCCTKDHAGNANMPVSEFLKAKIILTKDVSCSLPLLDFSEDASKIREVTKLNTTLYVLKSFPQNFNIQNKLLLVRISLLSSGEISPCNDLGINYPMLKSIETKNR